MERVGTSTILGFLPGLTSENDVTLFSSTATAFTDSLFAHPEDVPWEMKCLWIGMAAHQTPMHRRFILSRPQDPARLFELGKQGFPLLIVNGTEDQQVKGDAVVTEMKQYFKNLKICMIEKGGSHAIHYENEKEVMDSIVAFASEIVLKVSSLSAILSLIGSLLYVVDAGGWSLLLEFIACKNIFLQVIIYVYISQKESELALSKFFLGNFLTRNLKRSLPGASGWLPLSVSHVVTYALCHASRRVSPKLRPFAPSPSTTTTTAFKTSRFILFSHRFSLEAALRDCAAQSGFHLGLQVCLTVLLAFKLACVSQYIHLSL